MAFKAEKGDFYKAVTLDEEGNPEQLTGTDRVKATAQVVGGAALAVAGVPMLILPGPGALTVVTGATIALNGERKLSGREVTPLESALEATGEKLADTAKEAAGHAKENAAKKIRETSDNVLNEMPDAVSNAVIGAKDAVLDVTERVPAMAASAAKSAQQAGGVIAEEAPKVAATAAAAAGIVGSVVAGAMAAKSAMHK